MADTIDVPPPGCIAVIFVAARTAADPSGYAAAADAMATRAATMPGYLGLDSARGDDGIGMTISWWTDRGAAEAWRDDPDHARIRDQGRAVWYDWYRLIVTVVERGYDWRRKP